MHTNRVNRVIKSEKLVERGYLKIDLVKKIGKEKNIIYARLDPLISIIEHKIALTDLEKHVLERLLKSRFFRYLISNINVDINFGTSPLFYIIIMNLDYWSTFYIKNRTLTTIGEYLGDKLISIEQYENIINEVQESFDENEFKSIIKWFKNYDELLPILKLIEHGKENVCLYL